MEKEGVIRREEGVILRGNGRRGMGPPFPLTRTDLPAPWVGGQGHQTAGPTLPAGHRRSRLPTVGTDGTEVFFKAVVLFRRS